MLVLRESEIRHLVPMRDAVAAVEIAFARLSEGKAQLPAVIHFDFPDAKGDAHVKGAHLLGSDFYVVKVASGFYDNPERGLDVGSGLVLAFDARTGQPRALLLDNGFLTDLRTGAAGAVAAKHLANPHLSKVGLIGAGVEAGYQLRALIHVREVPQVDVWSRSPERAQRFAESMIDELSLDVRAVLDPELAVKGADLVITATPSRDPIVQAHWLQRGAHVTALGSDGPEKQELAIQVIAQADTVIADSIAQCLVAGEIHHAVAGGAINEHDVAGELGDVILGRVEGRRSDLDLTVCDLTGVGVQDAAVAALAIDGSAARSDVGQTLSL
jgi:ectoine utilization protein EutC